MRRATVICFIVPIICLFLSTLSLRRATCALLYRSGSAGISIHALLAESDCCWRCNGQSISHFYPRSPCGERRDQTILKVYGYGISIHALLAESDKCSFGNPCRKPYFYPRSPCGERRQSVPRSHPATPISIHALLAESDAHFLQVQPPVALFLSTLSLRRATCYSLRYSASGWHFYPRSPCGERPNQCKIDKQGSSISIHALLAESDEPDGTVTNTFFGISIHALLAESDS